jgi:hypothetical protein
VHTNPAHKTKEGKANNMNITTRLLLLTLLASSITITLTTTHTTRKANASTTIAPLPSINLTIIGNGTTITLNETEISNLQTISGYGEYVNAIGQLGAGGNYTGVPLTTLCSLVENLTNTSTVTITASDNYTRTLTYTQTQGNITTYDNTTAQPTPHNQTLTPIIAYRINGTDLSNDTGPLELAIIGPEGLATPAPYWVKKVVKIQITDQTIPELPQLAILPILFTTALLTLYLKTHKRRHTRLNDEQD